MDDATQKLVDDLAIDLTEKLGGGFNGDEFEAIKSVLTMAAQRPPVAEPDNHHNADVCPFCTRNRDEREAAIRAEALAQRPPVSPEQREAVAQAVMGALGCEVLDDTCECDYPCSHGLYAYCKTHDWEVVFNPGAPCPMAARVTDAVLARFSADISLHSLTVDGTPSDTERNESWG